MLRHLPKRFAPSRSLEAEADCGPPAALCMVSPALADVNAVTIV